MSVRDADHRHHSTSSPPSATSTSAPPPILPTFGFTAVLASVACLVLACAAPPSTPTPSRPGASIEDLAVTPSAENAARSTFHGFDSRRVVAAAMTYPTTQIAAEPPPLSLTASDGTGLQLVTMNAHAVVDGPLAFTELRLRFRNPENRTIEGRFQITLPPKATISRLAMKLSTGWQEAEVVEKQLARRAYEDFLHRRQDPALLEKEAGNEFRARIFPIPARSDKDIIISYSQPLVHDSANGSAMYRLPLRGLPEIEHLQVRALIADPGRPGANGQPIGYRSMSMNERRYKPTKNFEVPAPSAIRAIAAGELVAAIVEPELSTKAQAIDSLVVLFDTSASRAPGFSGQVKRLGTLLGALAKHHPTARLQLATFDQSVVPMYAGLLSRFADTDLDKIRAHRPLGASDMNAALTWVNSLSSRSRVLMITDAIPTTGTTNAQELANAVRALGPATKRLDMLLVGGIRDQDAAHTLARGTLARDGAVLDGLLPADVLATRLGQTTVSGIKLDVPGAAWVWPNRLDGVQAGDQALVFASIPNRTSATLTLNLTGRLSQTQRISLTSVAQPLLERAAVAAHIDRLASERDALDADKREARTALKKHIIKLSTQYRVLSDFTALLVLETERDYQRYGIDRRSLADILTVGERGVTLFHRQSPVLLIADETPTPKTKKVPKKKEALKRFKRDSTAVDGLITGARAEADADVDNAKLAEPPADLPPMQGRASSRTDEVATDDLVGRDPEPAAAPPPPPPPRPRLVPRRPAIRVARPASTSSDGDSEDSEELEVEEEVGAMTRPDGDSVDTRSFAAHGNTVTSRSVPLGNPRRQSGPPAYTGKMATMMALIARGEVESAVVQSLGWHGEESGNVMALIALGEALEKAGRPALAARAYGSLIDLFPSRADMRRFAGGRLERVGVSARTLAADSYAKAVEQRPDHLTGHRLLAYARIRLGDHAGAFAAIEAGLARSYPSGRFAGGIRILREDLGIIGAAWIRAQPSVRADVLQRLKNHDARLATQPSLRFVLNWETDANDVDFHIYDGHDGHAFYSHKQLPSGGELYADVTTGYGPECFTIPGTPTAYPYHLQIHYYSRGPMGYGMGKLQILEHDGNGNLKFEDRPFVAMNDGSYVDLGTVVESAFPPPRAGNPATIAR